MELTERQRVVLGLLNRAKAKGEDSVSEDVFHTMMNFNQEIASGFDYDFDLGYWEHIDGNFKSDMGGIPISHELHSDIEDMVKKGYILRDADKPLILRPKKPEFLKGLWVQEGDEGEALIYDFGMAIQGIRRNNGVEEIGGGIRDYFGNAFFYGERGNGNIKFKKSYDPEYQELGAARSRIIYKGSLEDGIYRGAYSYMHKGEISKEGEFVLTDDEEKLEIARKELTE